MAAVLDAHDHDEWLLLGTSGSTGRPRVVRRSTASWFDSFPVVVSLTGLDAGSRLWVPGPLSGTMNLFAAVLATSVGAALVGSPAEATHAHLTPTELHRWLDSEQTLSGRRVTVAGDRLSPTLHDAATVRGADVSHYYGAAELSFVAWGAHEDDLRPFPGVEVVERDGVLWARSPYLAEVETESGYATVGDQGSITPDGRVVVRGRGDAAVVTGGATVVAADVEHALRPALPGEVVVIAVPHPELGQVVAAVLTGPVDLATVRDHARAALPHSHRPRVWFRVEQLPLTPAGKPDRAALAAAAAAGDLSPVSPVGAG